MRFTDLQYVIFLAVVWVVFRALKGRTWFAVLWLTVAREWTKYMDSKTFFFCVTCKHLSS